VIYFLSALALKTNVQHVEYEFGTVRSGKQDGKN